MVIFIIKLFAFATRRTGKVNKTILEELQRFPQ
jgi:hypothetical protein